MPSDPVLPAGPPPHRVWSWRPRRLPFDADRARQVRCWLLGQLSQTTTVVGLIDAVALLFGVAVDPAKVEAVATVLGFVSPVLLLILQDRQSPPPGSC